MAKTLKNAFSYGWLINMYIYQTYIKYMLIGTRVRQYVVRLQLFDTMNYFS